MEVSFGKRRRKLRYSPQKFAEFLRTAANAPVKTADAVARDLGLSKRRAEDLLAGAEGMRVGTLLAAVGAYGVGALAACFEEPPECLDIALRAEQRARIEAEVQRLSQSLSRF